MRLLLALLLTACAGPTSHTYAQAAAPAPAMPPPAITYTPAGAGLPDPGQPGASPPAVERSPYSRVLPPSAEKGLWAAQTRPTEPAAVLGTPLPAPEAPSKDDAMLVRACATTLNSAVKRTYAPEAYALLSAEARRCLTAQLFRECLRRTIAQSEEKGTRQPLAKALAGAARDALPRAARFRDDACRGTSIPGFVSVSRIMDAWLGL